MFYYSLPVAGSIDFRSEPPDVPESGCIDALRQKVLVHLGMVKNYEVRGITNVFLDIFLVPCIKRSVAV